MRPETQRLSAADRDNLVAYLDGELPQAVREAMATALSRSVTARREVESLEKSWDLLDLLPRPKAPEDFLSRTLDEASRLDEPGYDWAGAGRRGTLAAKTAVWVVAAAIGGFGLGYVATARLWPDPTARLRDDLSLARHFEEYRAVSGDIDFLKELDRLPEFNADSP